MFLANFGHGATEHCMTERHPSVRARLALEYISRIVQDCRLGNIPCHAIDQWNLAESAMAEMHGETLERSERIAICILYNKLYRTMIACCLIREIHEESNVDAIDEENPQFENPMLIES